MTRLTVAAVLLATLGLGCSSQPPPVVHNEAPTPAPTPIDASVPGASIEIVVTEGSPSSLPDGATVDVRGIMYAHLANSENLSSATVVVKKGGQTVEVPLARHHKADEGERTWKPALGWEVRLEYADPYQQPGRVGLSVRRATP